VRYVVVCFSLYMKNSLVYGEARSTSEIHKLVDKCVERGAHVISIRAYLKEEK
jgi:hypothetical protein